MFGIRLARVADESSGPGPQPLIAGRHQHRPRQHRRRLVEQLRPGRGRLLSGSDPGESIQRQLPEDEPAIAALVVHVSRVPFAEQVVGPAVDGMSMIERPRVEGDLIQHLRVELGLVQQRGIEARNDLQSTGHQIVERPAHAGPARYSGTGRTRS